MEQVLKCNQGLAKSREKLARDLSEVFTGNEIIEELDQVLEKLEEILITYDIGIDTVDKILNDLREDARAQRLQMRVDIKQLLKSSLVRILQSIDSVPLENVLQEDTGNAPIMYLIIGDNGMGKTTRIGKLTTRPRQNNKLC